MSVSSASSSFSASSSLGSSFRSSVGTAVAPISVRTSDKTLRSFSSGGGVGSYTSSGSGSFISIHNEVQSGMSLPGIGGGITSIGKDYGGKPGGKPTDSPIGQKDPLVPVGDALIPMLLMIVFLLPVFAVKMLLGICIEAENLLFLLMNQPIFCIRIQNKRHRIL